MADRLIYADKLKKHYAWWKGGSREMTMDEAKSDFDTIIDLQPTVELKPIVIDGEEYLTGADYNAYLKGYKDGIADSVKHGHWIVDRKYGNDVMSGGRMVICSVCGKGTLDGKHNYCPNCGARMDGGEND